MREQPGNEPDDADTRRTKDRHQSESRWSHRPKALDILPAREGWFPAVTIERTRVAATEMVVEPREDVVGRLLGERSHDQGEHRGDKRAGRPSALKHPWTTPFSSGQVVRVERLGVVPNPHDDGGHDDDGENGVGGDTNLDDLGAVGARRASVTWLPFSIRQYPKICLRMLRCEMMHVEADEEVRDADGQRRSSHLGGGQAQARDHREADGHLRPARMNGPRRLDGGVSVARLEPIFL